MHRIVGRAIRLGILGLRMFVLVLVVLDLSTDLGIGFGSDKVVLAIDRYSKS